MSNRPLDVDLSGRVAVVTGANSDMGKETARKFAHMGAEVILGCRSRERREAARQEITASTGNAADRMQFPQPRRDREAARHRTV